MLRFSQESTVGLIVGCDSSHGHADRAFLINGMIWEGLTWQEV